MFVIDASAALEVLLKTPLGVRAAPGILNSDVPLHAPHLLDVEFMHALRRLARAGSVGRFAAESAYRDLMDLPLKRHAHDELLPAIWDLRDSLSAYDATYVALAEALDVPLLTCDAKLTHAHGHRADIRLLR